MFYKLLRALLVLVVLYLGIHTGASAQDSYCDPGDSHDINVCGSDGVYCTIRKGQPMKLCAWEEPQNYHNICVGNEQYITVNYHLEALDPSDRISSAQVTIPLKQPEYELLDAYGGWYQPQSPGTSDAIRYDFNPGQSAVDFKYDMLAHPTEPATYNGELVLLLDTHVAYGFFDDGEGYSLSFPIAIPGPGPWNGAYRIGLCTFLPLMIR